MTAPKTVSFSGEELLKMKGNVSPALLENLKAAADAHLKAPLYAVTERMMKAASGNPHDYSSIGTYWWPNPDTPDGLPYVRRDGEVTPAATDPIDYENMTKAMMELALAAFYFDNEEYGRAAERMLYAWHLDPETYMTPHAEYSQAIPGICSGRGIGIIDFSMRSYRVFDAVGILDYLGYISKENVEGLKAWYTEFTDWMLTSEMGLTEDTELNNHGMYFDVHVLSAAMFTGREALVKKICETAYSRRIAQSVNADGAQPLELARTMAMIYSISNIRAMLLISNMADASGYSEYFGVDKKYGDNPIKKAVDFIYPYYLKPETFPYPEMCYDKSHIRMHEVLVKLDAHFPGYGYKEKADAIIAEHCDKLFTHMLYPAK